MQYDYTQTQKLSMASDVSGADLEEMRKKDEAAGRDIFDYERLLEAQGYVFKTNIREYYGQLAAEAFMIKKRPTPLPLFVTLTIYGISSIQPGDIFRINYVPEIYQENVYFQTMKVTHNVGSDGWFTTLETQMRHRPGKKYTGELVQKARGVFMSAKILSKMNISHQQHPFEVEEINRDGYHHQAWARGSNGPDSPPSTDIKKLAGYITKLQPIAPMEYEEVKPLLRSFAFDRGLINPPPTKRFISYKFWTRNDIPDIDEEEAIEVIFPAWTGGRGGSAASDANTFWQFLSIEELVSMNDTLSTHYKKDRLDPAGKDSDVTKENRRIWGKGKKYGGKGKPGYVVPVWCYNYYGRPSAQFWPSRFLEPNKEYYLFIHPDWPDKFYTIVPLNYDDMKDFGGDPYSVKYRLSGGNRKAGTPPYDQNVAGHNI